MTDVLDIEPDFDSFRDLALESERLRDKVIWLERALKADPSELETVLRVAVSMENFAERTLGKAYIAKLEKLVRQRAREKRSNN